jgi:hypothetical protein
MNLPPPELPTTGCSDPNGVLGGQFDQMAQNIWNNMTPKLDGYVQGILNGACTPSITPIPSPSPVPSPTPSGSSGGGSTLPPPPPATWKPPTNSPKID